MWAILMLTLAQPAPPAIRLTLEPGTVCATARDITPTTLADAERHHAPEYLRYVWIPDWVNPRNGYAQASHIANSTFSRTANIVRPTTIADGRIVRFDLTAFASSERSLAEIVDAYERLANHETYFGRTDRRHSVAVAPSALALGDACEVRVGDEWHPGKFAGTREAGKIAVDRNGVTYVLPAASVRSPPSAAGSQPSGHRSPASHLGDAGRRLFDLTRSGVPIIRLDEFVAFGFSTINGGEYNALTGIEADLQSTVAKFAGADAASKLLRQSASLRRAEGVHRKEGGGRSIYEIAGELDPELAKSKALITHSGVTGRQRLAVMLTGSAIAPTEGLQLVSVTFDIAEDNLDPDADPRRNLSTYEKYNGGEAILARSNGMLVYLVFDANDRIIASVPDNVAHDFRARQVRANAATTRVFSGLSCANCHDWAEKQLGWQPLTNDMAASLKSITRFLGDKGSRDRLAEVQRIASAYKADELQLTEMLDGARRQYQRAVQAACGMGSREVVQGEADSYWGYWYDAVTPEIAARDLGQVLTPDAAHEYLLQIEPAEAGDIADLVREDIVFAQLKEGKSITPVQWRTIQQSIAERAWGAN